jgi:hypothetical protein
MFRACFGHVRFRLTNRRQFSKREIDTEKLRPAGSRAGFFFSAVADGLRIAQSGFVLAALEVQLRAVTAASILGCAQSDMTATRASSRTKLNTM